jgi:hypothetical protein
MKEEFESNLANEQKTELSAQSDFEGLKAAKEAEIAAGVAKGKEAKQSLADAENALAEAKENLESTRGALAADTQFLQDLTLRCQQTDADFDQRTKARTEEMAAVSEAVVILSDDDARDNFSKTLSFVQVARVEQKEELDPFKKVRASIDEMVKSLKAEQANEVVEKDTCASQINENEKATMLKQREITEHTTFIEASVESIAALAKDVQRLQAETAETKKQMDNASEEREAQNKEFQGAVNEQRAAKQVLEKALARLQKVYHKKSLVEEKQAVRAKMDSDSQWEAIGPSFLQQEPGAEVAPMPEGFAKYEKKGPAGILGLMENIIKDCEHMEQDALKAETEAQSGYEEFINDSTASIKQANAVIAEKTVQASQMTADKVTAEADRTTALNAAEQLHATDADLHQSCDFLIKNFDVRQAGRAQEIEALLEAKAVFSGADFS